MKALDLHALLTSKKVMDGLYEFGFDKDELRLYDNILYTVHTEHLLDD